MLYCANNVWHSVRVHWRLGFGDIIVPCSGILGCVGVGNTESVGRCSGRHSGLITSRSCRKPHTRCQWSVFQNLWAKSSFWNLFFYSLPTV